MVSTANFACLMVSQTYIAWFTWIIISQASEESLEHHLVDQVTASSNIALMLLSPLSTWDTLKIHRWNIWSHHMFKQKNAHWLMSQHKSIVDTSMCGMDWPPPRCILWSGIYINGRNLDWIAMQEPTWKKAECMEWYQWVVPMKTWTYKGMSTCWEVLQLNSLYEYEASLLHRTKVHDVM